jgi:hypothetical protein
VQLSLFVYNNLLKKLTCCSHAFGLKVKDLEGRMYTEPDSEEKLSKYLLRNESFNYTH